MPKKHSSLHLQRYHKAPHHHGRWGLWCGSPHPFCMWSGSRSWEPKLCNKVLNSHPRLCLQSTLPASLQAAPSPPLTGKLSSGYALPAQAWSVRGSWQRPSTKPHAQGPKGNPALVPFSRGRVVISDLWALCPIAWHPRRAGEALLALRKEPAMEVTGGGAPCR